MEIRIRPAIESDARGIMEIYNYSIVVERNATFDTIPKTLEDRTQWIRSQGDRYPIVVAELNDQIIGWASVSSYRTRECYQGVGEFSVYGVLPTKRGKHTLSQFPDEKKPISLL